ncbi:DUF485 domain-containing protein [Alicyclobacillus sp.]|uniref:DUF485 domain-containing protein n=1 Tax=Alicyclobacillus sp. TaxID=61169 RepID=UPI0025BC8991|nr:DUF485 domain-containing protein [Alicyclobacillus sp.]
MTQPNLSDPWANIASATAFRQLVHRKKRFLVPTIIFFLAYYLLLCVFAGWAKSLMGRHILGSVNFGYLFALSQFVMVWVICWLYVRRANEFDRLAEEIKKEARER